MNKKILILGALMICLSVGGCSRKDSGLYQVELNRQGIAADNDFIDSNEMVEIPNEADKEPLTIYVHVCGAVNRPGVYEFVQGDRVFQAVDAAGGLASDASEASVNLAMELSDGDKLFIPTIEEAQSMKQEAVEASDGLVNINRANADELETIPGIGATRAKAIIDYRDSEGKFRQIEDIMKVSGIGESTYSKLKDYITVGE